MQGAGAQASSNAEASAIEEIREGLLRDYGHELVRDELAFYIRLPVARISDLQNPVFHVLERLLHRQKNSIQSNSTTTFVITDQDFIELDTSKFLLCLELRQAGPIQEAARDAMSGVSGGRDVRLRRMLTEVSQSHSRKVLEKVRRGGRGAEVLTKARRGRVVGYRQAPDDGTQDIAIIPTVRAAVMRGAKIGTEGRLRIETRDMQENIRYTKVSSYVALVVDTSSYDDEVQERIKSLTRSLLLDAYERRDQVGLVLSRGNRAVIASDFTTDVEAVRRQFLEATWGGLSPFASGIMEGIKLFLARLADAQDTIRIMVLLTTGKANVALVQGGDYRRELAQLPRTLQFAGLEPLVVDVTSRGLPFLREFAQSTSGRYYHPPTTRYHQVALAQELLSSIGSGERDRAAAVGRALLSKIQAAQRPDSG